MPSQTQVVIQREYRTRKRNEMGDEAYRRLEAQKRKERRDRKRAQAPVSAQEAHREEEKEALEPAGAAEVKEIIKMLNSFLNKKSKLDLPTVRALVTEKALPALVKLRNSEGCDALFEAVFAARANFVKEQTKHTKNPKTLNKKEFKRLQWGNMLKLYRDIHNTTTYDCESLDWLKDTKKVIDFIKQKYPKPNTYIAKISNLASITSVLEGFNEAYRDYSKVSTSDRVAKTNIDDNNELTDKERKDILPWNQLKDLYKNEELSLKTRAIIGLYTTIPPRRAELGKLLTIVYDDKDLDPDFNYLVIDENTKKPKKIVMLKYKTDDVYGRYNIKLNNETYKTILQQYIIENNLRDYSVVFGTQSGSYYKSFSNIISDQFKTAVKKKISVNLLRHSYISDFLSTKRSLAERKALAKQMGHSIHVQATYERIDLKELNEFEDGVEMK